MDVTDPLKRKPRAKAFYFQGLPVQAHQPTALAAALEPYLQLESVRYFCWLDKPARDNLDLAPPMETAVAEILARQPCGEINLLGYSIGGYAAMYIATRLAEHGRQIGFVALLDSSSYYPFKKEPSLRQRLSARGDTGLSRLLALHLLVYLLHHRHFELARWLTLLAIRLRGRQAAGEMISKTLALYWKEAVLHFPPRRFNGKISLFVAERGRPRISDPVLGWGPYVDQITKVVLQGDHWTLLEEPLAAYNAQLVAQTLGLSMSHR